MPHWLMHTENNYELQQDAFARYEYGRLGSPLRASASHRYVRAIEAGRLELTFYFRRKTKPRDTRGSDR